jgi:methionyl-tRNA synthetase
MPFFISTPIYYVNAKPHLGHAYTTIVADSLARFQKAQGKEVFFLTGVDEHGDKIVQAAEDNGLSPKAYVDGISALFKELWPRLGVEYTQFIRTTDEAHKKCVQDVLQLVYDKGDIYFGEYGGHYCYGCERFYTEKELENGLCPQHQKKPEFIQEKNYFFKMAKYQSWLIEHIKQNRDFIRPEGYRNEVLSLLESGALEDLCISRPKSRLTWGVELPFDKDFVCYVWFDALINYISALGWPDGQNFKNYWPQAQHLVAKDILKPHAVFWPTMLKAAGLEPYAHLNVHGYWLIKDIKMSKSLGNVVEPLSLVEKYGVAAFRYFLLREMQFGHDASFSEEALVARLNADLANDLGNLFSRVLTMTHKYFEGRIPDAGTPNELDEELKQLALTATTNFRELFGRVMFARALEALWELVRGLNKYIDQCAPWALFKNGDTARLGSVMYNALEGMRKVAVHLWPVMPETAMLMIEQLGLAPSVAPSIDKDAEVWGLLPSGALVAKSSNLFPRRELDVEAQPVKAPKPQAEKAKADKAQKKASAPVEPPAAIEFQDFQKVDLRVGTVLVAEKHPEADKLLRLEIDLSEERPRQVIAGLAEFWKPEELVGKQVVVVANLAPRKLRGLESHGMVLAVRTPKGLELLGPTAGVVAGSKVS